MKESNTAVTNVTTKPPGEEVLLNIKVQFMEELNLTVTVVTINKQQKVLSTNTSAQE